MNCGDLKTRKKTCIFRMHGRQSPTELGQLSWSKYYTNPKQYSRKGSSNKKRQNNI
jgi:hypothetical protein